MTLTRKMLKAMSIEDEKIDQIIEAHGETVEALKSERDTFKAEAEQVQTLKTELEELKADNSGDEYQAKYKAEHEAFEAFKNQVETEKANSVKDGLYRELLKGIGVDETRFDSIMKVTDLSALEVEDGKLKDADALTESAKADYSGFILEPGSQGAVVPNPPAGGGTGDPVNLGELSMADYIKARQQ